MGVGKKNPTPRRAVIVGAGPAGLTAAHELCGHGGWEVLVLESSEAIGGLSRTVVHAGNRIDIGGHRFFSKSRTVMDWWRGILPLQRAPARDQEVWHGPRGDPDPERHDRVMLERRRRSRIFHRRHFFPYPLRLDPAVLARLGLARSVRILASYLRARHRPREDEDNLEDFLINRFGVALYRTFFRRYTAKVWGVPCRAISPEWGAQRIKGLSIAGALRHAGTRLLPWGRRRQARETSLIERFWYPKFGPGQLWERVADLVRERGGEVRLGRRVVAIEREGSRVVAVRSRGDDGGEEVHPADAVFSTMPIRALIPAIDPPAPESVREVAAGLCYRDFITVGLLLRRFRHPGGGGERRLADNWIYVQEDDVLVGRLQLFNNWSPYLVRDHDLVWVGMEYFCQEGDRIWNLEDEAMAALAIGELARLGFAFPEDVVDRVVIRVPKAYPSYFGTYDRFDEIRAWLDGFENLFPIGRNGMHRYNNADHSMLAAMEAVRCLVEGDPDRERLWSVNAEREYHETRRE